MKIRLFRNMCQFYSVRWLNHSFGDAQTLRWSYIYVFGSLWTFGESQLAVNDERRCLKLTVRSRCSRCGPSWYDEAACTELRQPESRWTPEKRNIDKGDSFGLTRQIWGILGKSILLLTFFENASLEFSVQKSCFQNWNIDKGTKHSL